MPNRKTAAWLALLLGGLGAHKFYLGRWGWGLIYLFFCFTFVPMVIGFFEAIAFFSTTDKAFAQRGGVSSTHVACPECRESVLMEARKCKHCGAKLTPSSMDDARAA